MDIRNNRLNALDRLVRAGLLLAALATVGALAAAMIDFDLARPIAVVAGTLLVVCVVASALRSPESIRFDDTPGTQINPASGLPMLGEAHIDVRGNAYGRNDH